ncbi:hypothetical protein [uncultured Hoeflea sp.]|uniref:hypothetical protein n=1 Tax=uncultured Hoeflea sp. TaxID=538666 RepID=UPI0026112134|nr:hypothetical protein [uncultured Hoeflea sp.]
MIDRRYISMHLARIRNELLRGKSARETLDVLKKIKRRQDDADQSEVDASDPNFEQDRKRSEP